MHMLKILSTLLLVTPLLMAQGPDFHFKAVHTPMGGHESLQDYLSLTDEQVRQLGDLRRDQFERMRPAMEQLGAKQRELDQALEASSPDPVLGRLTIEMQQLRQSMPGSRASLHEQALAILSGDQSEKIAKLSEALQLHATATEAVSLNLLDADLPAMAGRAVWFGQRSGNFEGNVSAPIAKTMYFRGRSGVQPVEVGGERIVIREQIVK